MARIHEYQGKQILDAAAIPVPRGGVATTPQEAAQLAEKIGGEVMVKAQAWITGRAGVGGIQRAATPEEAAVAAEAMLGMQVKGFTVEQVLVEERLDVALEFYAGIIVATRNEAPLALLPEGSAWPAMTAGIIAFVVLTFALYSWVRGRSAKV